MNINEVINRIEKLLEKKKWSKYKLAKESNLPQSTITSVLSGKVKDPSLESLSRIADALNVSTSWLIGEPDHGMDNIELSARELKKGIIRIVRLFTDKEGCLDEKHHEVFFRWIYSYFPFENQEFVEWYRYSYLSGSEEEMKKMSDHAVEQFDKNINYHTIKKVIDNYEVNALSLSLLESIYSNLKDLQDAIFPRVEARNLVEMYNDPILVKFLGEFSSATDEQKNELLRYWDYLQSK